MYQSITRQLKKQSPLILNITNDVTMDFIANGLLSIGASPLMMKAPEEAEELISLAHVVIINPGTLHDSFIQLADHVCTIANKLEKPIILDPVGAGASIYRTQTNLHFLKNYSIAIVRGNSSEIMALKNFSIKTKGVDSTKQSEEAMECAKMLSTEYNTVIFISGKTDYIVHDQKVNSSHHGSPMMTKITGTGCLLSSVVGAFHAVEKDPFKAATAAAIFYGLCGEKAALESEGPGTFKLKFIDQLHLLS